MSLQWVLLAWTDDECKKVLQNCYKALPADGKLIACEPVLPELTDESQRTRALLGDDIFIMTMDRTKGKHRTEEQLRQLGIFAGFLVSVPSMLTLIGLYLSFTNDLRNSIVGFGV